MGKARRNKRLRSQLPGEKERPVTVTPSSLPPGPRSRFTHVFGSGLLRAFGPFFFASWWVPSALAKKLADEGKPIPSAVPGVIVIDTGADGTCISKEVADRLGLKVTRIQPGFGVAGECNNPVYLAHFSLKITERRVDGTPVETTLEWEQEVLGVPNLGRRKITAGGREFEVIGLLGRDVLQHCRMTYDGLSGSIDVAFDLTAMKLSPSR